MGGFLSDFVTSPGPYVRIFFEFAKKKTFSISFYDFVLVFVTMGLCGSKYFKTLLLKFSAKTFQTYPEFSSNGPRKTAFMFFEFLKIDILTFFFFVFDLPKLKCQNVIGV